ncbi:MAG: hypothetical protein ACOY3Z_12065 [Thermodesulfobacteriota bacterium]
MAEDDRPKQQTDDPFASLDIAADHDSTDWGEDWEAAFKADDATFFTPDETETEGFFLDEEAKPAAGGQKPSLDASLQESLASIPDQQAAALRQTGAAAASPPLPERLKETLASLSGRLQQLPPRQRMGIYIGLPSLLLLVVLLPLLIGSPPPPQPPPGEASHSGEPSPSAPTAGETPPPAAPQESAAATSEATPPPEQAAPIQPKIRRKWAFTSFLIPTSAGSGQPVSFVIVDLTLVASLPKAEEPPPEKLALVRDAIFQFYQNRPIEELRRYSLARGEMTRKLKEWITMQWPEAPIESITFERYRLS